MKYHLLLLIPLVAAAPFYMKTYYDTPRAPCPSGDGLYWMGGHCGGKFRYCDASGKPYQCKERCFARDSDGNCTKYKYKDCSEVACPEHSYISAMYNTDWLSYLFNSKKQKEAYRQQYVFDLNTDDLVRRKGLYQVKRGNNNTFPAFMPGCMGDVIGNINHCVFAKCVPDEGYHFNSTGIYPFTVRSGTVESISKLFPKMYRCEHGVHCINGFKKPCPDGMNCVCGVAEPCPEGATCENGILVKNADGTPPREIICE